MDVFFLNYYFWRKVNRKVQEEPQAEVAANPWHQDSAIATESVYIISYFLGMITLISKIGTLTQKKMG